MKRDVQRVPESKYRVMTNAEVSRSLADEMEVVLNEGIHTQAHGIVCLEYKVLVRPVEAKRVTAGGIHIPDETKDRDDAASMEGELVGVSPLAFSYEEAAPRPDLGATVVFQKFAGVKVRGNDGIEYRLMNDKDVVAWRVGK